MLLAQLRRWAIGWPAKVSLIHDYVDGLLLVDIALGHELVLEQNFEDPDARAVLGQVDIARHGGTDLSRSICRRAASRGERTGLLRGSVLFRSVSEK